MLESFKKRKIDTEENDMTRISLTPYKKLGPLLVCRSNNRTDPSADPGNCEIRLANPVVSVTSAKLVNWIIPSVFYNVTSTIGTFVVGGTAPIVLTPGQYDATSLASHLQTQINAYMLAAGMGITVTVTYSTTTFRFIFTYSGATNMSFVSSSNAISRLLGFVPGVNYPTTANVVTAPNAAQLNRPEFLYVQVSDWPMDRVVDGTTNIGPLAQFKIVLPDSNGNIVYRDAGLDVVEDENAQHILFHGQKTLTTLRFVFYDPEWNVVSFQGADWTMDFRFCY